MGGARRSRDLSGYGARPPDPRWPGGASLALSFVLNVEEGAEQSLVNGDAGSEPYGHDLHGRPGLVGQRDYSVEGLFEYGSRAGFWRLLRMFGERGLPLTAFACGRALELNPDAGAALAAEGHEVAGHGYRWIDYRDIDEAVERDHIRRTVAIIEQTCGRRPRGWYTGRASPNTRQLLIEHGGFDYDSDAYNDDLPYWLDGTGGEGESQLIIPYTLVNNDFRYLLPNGFSNADDFYLSLRAAFDVLLAEGATAPKMMSVGLHSRISGQPARAAGLARFLDDVLERGDVWVCRRLDIARHWREQRARRAEDRS